MLIAECGKPMVLKEERVWERRVEFLTVNPAATLPIMVEDGGDPICGINAISHYFFETYTSENLDAKAWKILPDDLAERAEVRRLVDWFDQKFAQEVTVNIVGEKIIRRFTPDELGGGPPDMKVIHVGSSNIKIHLRYIEYLLQTRDWLAGQSMSWADLSAAAHLSCVDYLGHVPWDDFATAKDWFVRIKSRPSFRPLLSDRIPGAPPAAHYVDLDF